MLDDFICDISKVANLLKTRDNYFYNFENKELFYKILQDIDLPKNENNLFAIKQRICFLRDDLLLSELEKQPFDKMQKSKDIVFNHISSLYQNKHQELINEINKQKLLTPFYRYIISQVHNIGISMSSLAIKWQLHIQTINKDLEDNIGNSQDIFKYLNKNSLIDTDNKKESDRCYSVLVKVGNGYKVLSYSEAFVDEVEEIVSRLDIAIDGILEYKDEVFSQEREYLQYFKALKEAFLEKDTDLLIQKYREIDIQWMSIKSPIQIGHPLEYYEDQYRKSVAIEWDIRLSTSSLLKNDIASDINNLASFVKKDCNGEYENIYSNMSKNLESVQLYLGRPMIYYGTSFNGMFSAQVVPNDEIVSTKYGKKIFAFADSILENIKAKPFMQIDKEVFNDDFLTKSRKVVFSDEKKWHKIYEISTIGHEYGHILWCDEDSEAIMDKSGQFKNVEEFKATTGGLLAHFTKSDDLYELLLIDTIKRAVKLLIYASHEDIRAYYVESLLHLFVLFDCNILDYENEKLHININYELYKIAKKNYENIYKDLIYNFYLPKNDPIDFLKKYISIPEDNKNIYLPKDKKIKEFALYFQELYKKIGSQIDENSTKEMYQ